MAEVSYPSPAHNTRNVTDAEYETLSALFSGDGVYGDPTGAAVVAAGTGLQVLVKAGQKASVRGHAWDAGTTDTALAIASNASGSTRYDWVVLRLDRATWTVRAAIVEGTAGAGLPATTQDAGTTGVWEIVLAYVVVPNGAASVTVVPVTQYVGSRIRPANSNQVPPWNELGEVHYRPDTGEWEGWNGSQWVTIYSDSGELTLGGGFSTWEPFQENTVRKVTNHVTVHLSVRRINSNFHPGDDTGSKLATIPDSDLWPARIEYFAGRFTSDAGSVRIEVRTDGEIWAKYPDEIVIPGRALEQTMTYVAKGV